MMLENKETA